MCDSRRYSKLKCLHLEIKDNHFLHLVLYFTNQLAAEVFNNTYAHMPMRTRACDRLSAMVTINRPDTVQLSPPPPPPHHLISRLLNVIGSSAEFEVHGNCASFPMNKLGRLVENLIQCKVIFIDRPQINALQITAFTFHLII